MRSPPGTRRASVLSNDESMQAVQRLIGAELKTLCLIHLSEKNYHESIVKDMADRVLKRTGAHVQLGIARQSGNSTIYNVSRRSAKLTRRADVAVLSEPHHARRQQLYSWYEDGSLHS